MTKEEMQAIIEAVELLEDGPYVKEAISLLRPLSDSFKDTLLFQFGVTDDEVPF